MRKHVAFSVLLGTLLSFAACKKGPNDPAFTLLTRTARLQGTWQLQSGEWSHNDTTWVFANDEVVRTIGDQEDPALPFDKRFTFDRNGDYELREVYDYPDNYNDGGNPSYTLTRIEQGVWNFAGGEGEEPNKSKLLLIQDYLEQRFSIAGSDVEAFDIEGPTEGFLYNINELRSDRLVLRYEQTVTNENGSLSKTANLVFQKQ